MRVVIGGVEAETYNAEINSPFSAEINSAIHPQCKMMVFISRYPAKHT
jgi:hypothetical protein